MNRVEPLNNGTGHFVHMLERLVVRCLEVSRQYFWDTLKFCPLFREYLASFISFIGGLHIINYIGW